METGWNKIFSLLKTVDGHLSQIPLSSTKVQSDRSPNSKSTKDNLELQTFSSALEGYLSFHRPNFEGGLVRQPCDSRGGKPKATAGKKEPMPEKSQKKLTALLCHNTTSIILPGLSPKQRLPRADSFRFSGGGIREVSANQKTCWLHLKIGAFIWHISHVSCSWLAGLQGCACACACFFCLPTNQGLDNFKALAV